MLTGNGDGVSPGENGLVKVQNSTARYTGQAERLKVHTLGHLSFLVSESKYSALTVHRLKRI